MWKATAKLDNDSIKVEESLARVVEEFIRLEESAWVETVGVEGETLMVVVVVVKESANVMETMREESARVKESARMEEAVGGRSRRTLTSSVLPRRTLSLDSGVAGLPQAHVRLWEGSGRQRGLPTLNTQAETPHEAHRTQ